MEKNIASSKPMEYTQNKRYNYIVGIDFGTYSTSFSFVHVDYENDIRTIKDWKFTKKSDFGGRVASSIIYEQQNSDPLFGGFARKRLYDENNYFFYAPRVKPYLTDGENQPILPGDLTPVKLVSDYLKQLHKYGVDQMETYFQNKNEESRIKSISVTEDQIRYIFSYPDNQKDDKYITRLKEALEMAGIISPGDPEYRLKFIPESSATAYFCSNTPNHFLKPSKKPYLVCDIGDEVFGVSSIKAEELIEAGIIETHNDLSAVGCNNIQLDKNMKKYLKQKTATFPGDAATLELLRARLFDFFVEDIKPLFSNDNSTVGYIYNTKPGTTGSKIPSGHFQDKDENITFVFPYEDIKKYIFDPITDVIIERTEKALQKFEMGISGIFLSGVIGHDDYIKNIFDKKFGTPDVKIQSIKDRVFVVSEGLIYSGICERELMIPYFESRGVRQKNVIRKPGNEQSVMSSSTFSGIKKINHKDIDYIIGLDFGTTYSGFAYAPVPKNEDEAKKSHTLVIKEIIAWPKQTNGSYPKVPSMLYYNQKMEYLHKFGHEAKAESTKSKANGVLLRHFKLLLSRDFKPTVDDKMLKRLGDFDIVDAIANFLKDFNKEGITRMKRAGLKVDEDRLGYVVTIPAMWPDEAKNTMRAAAKKAGLVNKKNEGNLDDRLIFITEAEAAALYCEKYYKDEFSMDRQQRFMICDAGGGTVDLVTFEVGQEEGPNGNPVISELSSGDGDNCGSVYVDDNFKQYISEKFNSLNASFSEKGIESLVDQFIRDIKPNFEPSLDPDMEEEIRLQIPMSLGLPTDLEDGTGFIQNNEIIIPYADMENEVFKPVVNKVLNLIDKQLRKLPEGERQLDAILVVGGFGQSLYLHQKIIDKFENKAVGAVFIGKPPNGDLAICRGAVSFGLEPRLVSEGITRYTYGLQVKHRFKKQDNPAQKLIGYDGKEYCQNVLTEIVAKETKINKGTVYTLTTFVTYPKNPIFAIYSVDVKNNDKNLRTIINDDKLQPICKLTAKMPDILGIKEGDKVEFEVEVEITGTNINVDILYEGETLTEKVVTKANTVISKKKYELGSRAEPKKKRRWGVQIFSLSS